jgi:hypothetical protein
MTKKNRTKRNRTKRNRTKTKLSGGNIVQSVETLSRRIEQVVGILSTHGIIVPDRGAPPAVEGAPWTGSILYNRVNNIIDEYARKLPDPHMDNYLSKVNKDDADYKITDISYDKGSVNPERDESIKITIMKKNNERHEEIILAFSQGIQDKEKLTRLFD